MNARQQLENIIAAGMTQQEAFAFFDELEPIDAAALIGRWKGREAPAQHPLDGALTVCPWYGKEFISAEEVHPLVFKTKRDVHYYVNPDFLFKPLDPVQQSAVFQRILRTDKRIDAHFFDRFFRLFQTGKSKARLRMVQHRGKVSAAMVYDNVPIYDFFRKVDEQTVLGVMDMKGRLQHIGYFFVLEKE